MFTDIEFQPIAFYIVFVLIIDEYLAMFIGTAEILAIRGVV